MIIENKIANFELADIEGGHIKKKALMSNNQVEKIIVPFGVSEIEAWAFAYCKNLKEIHFPVSVEHIDVTAFLEDDQLENVIVYSNDKQFNSKLMALGIRYFLKYSYIGNDKFLDFKSISKEQYTYVFMESLLLFLNTDDALGFDPFLAGGEEDYEAPENDLESFKKLRQCEKCKLILEFLTIYSDGQKYDSKGDVLENKSILKEYLSSHLEETLNILSAFEKNVFPYFKQFIELEIPDNDNFNYILKVFEAEIFAECLALLLSYKESHLRKEDIFDSFLL